MSFKVQTQKVGTSHYVLPKTGEMKCDVHAFLSESLFEASEENAWAQIAVGASYQGVKAAYLMPDCHVGYSVPVGSVIVTDDTIIQAGSGFDISCGGVYLKMDGISAGNVKSKHLRQKWVQEVERRVALGVGHNRPDAMPVFNKKEADNFLRYGAKALGFSTDLCERDYIPIPEDTDLHKIKSAYDKVIPQLGSVGGGNHFIEMQVDKADGSVWVMIHCGSRGYGYQTADHFYNVGAELRGLSKGHREESWLHFDEPLGKDYWAHHNSAANFASVNRLIIVNGIMDATEEVFGVRGRIYYEISHNLVQREKLLLPDGTFTEGFVHRKGATRAFPAGHPELTGTVWEKTGHPCCIPGSMYAGAAILFAESGASKSGFSVNHGSGRLLARGEAKRKLEPKQALIDGEMNDVQRTFDGVQIDGIMMNHRHVPVDECSHVYKDLDEVLGVLETEGIARVAHRMYPVANLKGLDTERQKYKKKDRPGRGDNRA